MTSGVKNTLLIIGSLLAIAASAAWIYYQRVRAPKHNIALHQRVGEVMAEETAKLLGHSGRLLVITLPAGAEPELQTQLNAFRGTLKKSGDFHIKEHELDIKDQPKYGVGTGLSGRRFVRIVKNHPDIDVLVSFVGAPKLSDDEIADLKKPLKFIAESRSTEHLPKLFEKQLIQVAIVSRFIFPAPGPLKPKTPQEWFDKRYQIVSAAALKSMPPAAE
jgi:hypothetical protein